MAEIELGARADGLENDRDHGLALGRAVGPGPSEHKLLAWDDFLVDTLHLVVGAARTAEYDAEAPAYAQVELRDRYAVGRRRAPPALQRFRVGPCPPDLFRGDRVAAGEAEGRFLVESCFFHVCSSSCWYR